MGWLIAILLAALVWLGLYSSGRCSRLALEIAAAAMLAGLAGYGWQGRPDLAGNPVGAPKPLPGGTADNSGMAASNPQP